MNELFNIADWIQLASIFGVAVAWWFDRKHRKSRDKQSEASAMQGMQEVYDKFVRDANLEIEEFREQVAQLKAELREAYALIEEQKKIIKQLKNERR